ncbi:tetratricopeptide repeat protein [Halalkalibacter alkaliphilus]|uniref:Tetratricopeptide repeat protein n=1 Tax=Halalkalibacter alkaliphilus TaxID=2917993 RepID=A0A9X2I700_9BACI|nr:tetratricopeptide repeat protein [Halalkalibacter alkaliphilus]MCL7749197.1 tetratricopeptide repeat protein [Halalkalibacter alkaliphilus]
MKKFFFLKLILVFMVACSQMTTAEQVDEKLKLGNKYLLEENYEEAILAYEEAIEIDPRSVDAYLGLVDIYIALEEDDLIVTTLKDGIDSVEETNVLREELADHYVDREMLSEAIDVYLEIVDSDLDNRAAIDEVIDLYQAIDDIDSLQDFLGRLYEQTGDETYQRLLEDLSFITAGELLSEFDPSSARFQTTMKDRYSNEYNIFIYSEDENVSTLEHLSFLGDEGDTVLTGDYRVVIQNEAGDFYLQDIVLENKTINTNGHMPYVVENSPDLLVFSWVERQDVNIVDVYVLTSEGLAKVHELVAVTPKLKLVETNQLQSLYYDRENALWTFTTVQVDIQNVSVETVEEQEFSLEEGRPLHELFSSTDDYVIVGDETLQYTTHYTEVELKEDDLVDEVTQYLLELKEYASKGTLGEGMATVGVSAEELVSILGEPREIMGYSGTELYSYEHADYPMSYRDGVHVLSIYQYKHQIESITQKQIIEVLGPPDDRGEDFNILMGYYINYTVGDHALQFIFDDNGDHSLARQITVW